MISQILCAVVLLVGHRVQSQVIQDLGGDDWKAVNTNKSIKVNSRVPGSIYTDLNRAGILEGDLYDNFNDVKYRWVSYDNWTFTKQFDVSENVFNQRQIFLTAHGLDTIGNVTLNGHLLGPVENMFVRYKWDVKKLLKGKANVIEISFESAPLYGKRMYDKSVKQKYPIPPSCPPDAQHGECHVNYLRKMQASFSWDWGPAFPTQGIWRPIALEAFSDFVLRTVSVSTTPKANNTWTLNTTVWLENIPEATSVTLALQLDGHLLVEKNCTVHLNAHKEAYVNVIVEVPSRLNIKRWYPNGVGDAVLYVLEVKVTSQHQTASKVQRIGFRTIELSQEELHPPKAGNNIINAYYFKVNGVPIFTKGSNWIPAHVLYEALTNDYLYDLLLSAKLANMNMIRVWGGGFYEDDVFYRIADELGILIYQDMMFSSSLYPADDAFMANVATEIRQQIRRLQHHPSIAIWAGNNENEGNIAGPYWQEIKEHWEQYKRDYIRLTINVTMAIILEEDTTRPFVSSCPSNGVADVRKGYIAHSDKRAGEMHWYIGDGDALDWRRYPSAKFVSEYGFQSLASLSVLEKYIAKEHLKYPLTEGVMHRQHLWNSASLTNMMKEQFDLVKNGSQLSQLGDFIYLNQIFQALAMKIESEFYRRNRRLEENGHGFTMGALYWQLNEAWPSFSWSSLEFGGKWKLLHYYVRNFFDNYLVDIYEDADHLKVVIVRDDHTPEKVNFTVTLKVFDWSSPQVHYTETFTALAEPFNVTHVWKEQSSAFLTKAKCPDRNRCFIQVSITGTTVNGDAIERSNFLLLGRVKNALGLHPATIRIVDISQPLHGAPFGFSTFTITLQTDQIAPFVWIDLLPESTVQGTFSDNGFILTNQTVLTFSTRVHLTKTQLGNLLTVKSLSDVKYS